MTATQTPATLLALHDADPEGLNVIAAELNGFKWVDAGGIPVLARTPESWEMPVIERPDDWKRRISHVTRYSTSLDAVAELEEGLTDEEHEEFRQHLWEIVGLPDSDPFDWSMKRNRAYLSAPAHLRLIAWVLTKQTI